MEDEPMIKKCIAACIAFLLFGMYCCLVVGKREDEVMQKLYQEKWCDEAGKDEV